jgi:polyisoprenyl-phosphate glycosyltransferase
MNDKEKNFVSAVLYIHNDQDVIASFLQRLLGVMDSHFEKFELIFVDDASKDRSGAILRELAKNLGSGVASIISMSYHQGLESCMNAGVDLAIGDFVFEFDTLGLDFDPELIIDVYRRSLEGFDIVSASGRKPRFSSSLFYAVFNKNANLQYELQTESFRILSRRAINRCLSMNKTIPYRKAIYANSGLKMDTLVFEPTKSGRKKKPDFQDRYDTAFDALILFTNLAYKITLTLTLVMMAVTLGGVIYTIVIYVLGIPVAGYTTTMLVITAGFFGVFGVLAVMIKYLSVLVRLVFNKQKYIIESVERVSKGSNE